MAMCHVVNVPFLFNYIKHNLIQIVLWLWKKCGTNCPHGCNIMHFEIYVPNVIICPLLGSLHDAPIHM
jgi:hypothetical protein